MLLALLAAAGVGLLGVGIYLPRSGKDVVAERLAAFNQRPRSLEEIELQQPVDKRDDALATEFARVLAEMRIGRSRRDALKDMVARTQVPDLNNFVGAILQAEQLGVSVTKVLTVQAEQMRTLRRQRAEEKAARLQLRMIFPLP